MGKRISYENYTEKFKDRLGLDSDQSQALIRGLIEEVNDQVGSKIAMGPEGEVVLSSSQHPGANYGWAVGLPSDVDLTTVNCRFGVVDWKERDFVHQKTDRKGIYRIAFRPEGEKVANINEKLEFKAGMTIRDYILGDIHR